MFVDSSQRSLKVLVALAGFETVALVFIAQARVFSEQLLVLGLLVREVDCEFLVLGFSGASSDALSQRSPHCSPRENPSSTRR